MPKSEDIKSYPCPKRGHDQKASWWWRTSRENVIRVKTRMSLCLGTQAKARLLRG